MIFVFRPYLPFFIYPFFIIIMLSTCGPQPAKQQDLSTLLPKAISKLQRVKLITDSQALEKINSLHGKEITVEAGVIGNYRSAQGQPAMVWISRSKTITLAREQTESMVAKMTENPRSPFHHPETLIIDGITVYRFMGMGQVHYIFRREAIVYWISAPPEEGKNMLAAFL